MPRGVAGAVNPAFKDPGHARWKTTDARRGIWLSLDYGSLIFCWPMRLQGHRTGSEQQGNYNQVLQG